LRDDWDGKNVSEEETSIVGRRNSRKASGTSQSEVPTVFLRFGFFQSSNRFKIPGEIKAASSEGIFEDWKALNSIAVDGFAGLFKP
jgi:hypothetical protein